MSLVPEPKFTLGQSVWVVDKSDRSITHGWVKAMKYLSSTYSVPQVTYTICKVFFFVSRAGNSGYEFDACEQDVFRSGPAALNELGHFLEIEQNDPDNFK